ncbi:MAG: TetR/AcrR family transcriptional regulator [Alphaproteobacteria bacterium]|nr:TetR/AcrR family transcriptional regulator [Alphaproteobacteria bacterium]
MPEERPGPEGGRRHANRLARTRALCEAAVTRFLADGLDAVTIDEVARAADVSKGSFYRYFQNKEELIGAVFAPIGAEIRDAMGACAVALEAAREEPELTAAYGLLAARLLGVLGTQPEVIRLFLQERHGPATPARAAILALDAEVVELAVRLTHAGQASGLLRRVDPRVSATLVLGGVHELLWRTFLGTGPDDPVASAQQLIDIVLHGVRAPAER